MGERSMVGASCVEATKVTQIGKAISPTPSSSTTWAKMVRKGRFSIIVAASVVHAPLDEAELDEGEDHEHGHQDHRLRRRAAEVAAAETVVVELEHQDG